MGIQDADRLDALGAIVIGRAFSYGVYKRQEMHNPNIQPKEHESFEQYRTAQGTTINHFYEKLLLLRERMNTKTGRRLAEEHHQFMEKYLTQFSNEWDFTSKEIAQG